VLGEWSPSDDELELNEKPAIHAKGLNEWFGEGEAKTLALKDVNLETYCGEIVYIVGPSGIASVRQHASSGRGDDAATRRTKPKYEPRTGTRSDGASRRKTPRHQDREVGLASDRKELDCAK
jgi:hypothetical protein